MEGLLIAEKLLRVVDLLKADIEKIDLELDHECALLEHRIIGLEDGQRDHEERIRSMQSGVISLKIWGGLSSVCAVILSLLALIRAMVGN